MFLKLLICSILLGPLDGWFPVKTVRVAPKDPLEADSSLWVLFSKRVGDEKFVVHLPEAPRYSYAEDGSLTVSAGREGEIFQLVVRHEGEEKGDLLYRDGEKWVREHFVQTPHHFYHFKGLSDQVDSSSFHTFISSFSIEENDIFSQN